ncbi:serine hydrolase domain-containing protein [Psychroserpens damuponensis]|uniref:serine hydrolase domain-containing protein n=1 Tax=Psychroserpens damuponensis TaxID=943936 RepID=UPI000AC5FBDA|nr:serine hydrolase domain-containing protein [Psychroserpens damuponensis]
MSIIKYFSTLVCVLALSPLNAQTDLTQQIDILFDSYKSDEQPGLSVKVLKHGKTIYSKGFGLSNLDYNIKNSDSTVFSLASIAKQFTAAAIWSLIEEEKLNLEDNLHQFFPNFPDYGKTIQIKHLLNHSSGIRNYHTTMFLSGFDPNRDYYDNAFVLNLAKRQKHLDFAPGEKIIYSNTNYNLLALIIEQISGQNLDEYLKTNILIPLGMTHTFVRVSHGTVIKNKAIGYQKHNDNFVYNTSTQLSYGAGSMGSNLKDLAIWATMLNGNHDQFKELATFLITSEILTTGKKANYARGVMIDEYKGLKTVSHSGYGFGGQTQLLTLPEAQISIIILTNLQSINPRPISYQILDLLLPSKQTEVVSTDKLTRFKPQQLNVFTGDYKEVNSDMIMQISEENDTLKAIGSMGKQHIPLLQVDTNKFVRRHAQHVTYDFTKTPNYDLIISFSGTPFYFKRATLITENPSNLNDFVGDYFSEELQTNYTFFIDDNTLKLSYKNHDNITLYPIQHYSFGNHDRTLYEFTTNTKGKIIGMLLSCDGQVSHIEFVRDQTQY